MSTCRKHWKPVDVDINVDMRPIDNSTTFYYLVTVIPNCIKGNQNPMRESTWEERVKWEDQYKSSFIKIGYEIRKLWKFEKSCCTIYGEPQIGKHASKWLILWTTPHLLSCTQISRFSPPSPKSHLASYWAQHMSWENIIHTTYVKVRRR